MNDIADFNYTMDIQDRFIHGLAVHAVGIYILHTHILQWGRGGEHIGQTKNSKRFQWYSHKKSKVNIHIGKCIKKYKQPPLK